MDILAISYTQPLWLEAVVSLVNEYQLLLRVNVVTSNVGLWHIVSKMNGLMFPLKLYYLNSADRPRQSTNSLHEGNAMQYDRFMSIIQPNFVGQSTDLYHRKITFYFTVGKLFTSNR